MAKAFAFDFIDPVYAWACCARRVSEKHELHFEYKEHLHPLTDERLYGASVAHGDIMKRAYMQVSAEPALMGN